ncbi:MAG: tRNA1(Val) (adenine(37)-N6)-methyltransferase [Hyphomicrobiaceae bacterium]
MPGDREGPPSASTGRVPQGSGETTRDAFLGGALCMHQPRQGYRAGLDAVLLAASVEAPTSGREQRLLDVGAGVGVVALCAAVRLPGLSVTLVEQSAALCALAEQNIAENSLGGRAGVVRRDIVQPGAASCDQPVDNSFDVVASNPPFYDTARHRPSPHALKAASHAMPDAGLDAWVRFMARMTKAGGTAIMIHRTDHLPAMLGAFQRRFGALTLLPLHPRHGEPASRVILRGVKGSRAPLVLCKGICLHGPDNRFTPEIDKVLKTPSPLPLSFEAMAGA